MTLEQLEMEPAVAAADDDVRQYLQDIRRYPLLTPEQELELAKGCAAGDEAAIRQMVNSNLRLVVSVAREYAGRGVPLLDLIQEGSIGLLAAARKFDYTLDCRFSTYATKWIRQGISKYLTNNSRLIRIPEHTAQRLRRIQSARTVLLQDSGTEPTAEQIGAYCGIPAQKVQQLLLLNPEICSLDTPVGEEDTLGVLLEDNLAPEPCGELIRDELCRIMDTLLGTLTDRQQQVLRLHFGITDGDYHSLEEISRILGISKERTRQIERQAMDKLQILGEGIGLEDFLE